MENNTTLIDRYLQNEMSSEERGAFEKQLAADKLLQEELRVQKLLVTAAIDTGLKNEFARAFHKKVVMQRTTQWVVAGTIVVAALVFLAIRLGLFSGNSHSESFKKGTEPTEQFELDNTKDTIIETKDGVVFAIPAGAFRGGNQIRLEIQTALNAYDIMEKGLSTMSNGSLLQTAGMFYLNGYENEKPVALAKDIAVSVPANNRNPNMQLFDGVEDGKGRVNWVNPKPIEKNLVTYEITSLDFYPPQYIPLLKELKKNFTNKRYTDSLYYSFSGYPLRGMTDTTKAALEFAPVIEKQNEVFGVEGNDQKRYRHQQEPDTLLYPKKDSSGHIDDYGDGGHHNYRIDPGKIKAIWDKKFNNTILATREFEERLRFLHSISNGESADLLAIYVNNLDKPLYVSDERCARAVRDEHIRDRFLEFAARKDGSVKIATGMQAKLVEYFQKRSAAYREAAKKTWEKYEAELLRLQREFETRQTEQSVKEFERAQKLFNEEYCINLTDAYRQIGVKRTCNDTIPVQPLPPATYEIIINTTGWKNLDVYVFDATTDRESMSYTDPGTGRTATLTYKELSIQVNDQSNYDRLLVYLIPDSLSSFQRIELEGDAFKENLNALFRYDLIILGYRSEEVFYHRVQNIQPGDHKFNLAPVSREALRDLLKNYSRAKAMEWKEEMEHQLTEQQELNRVVQLRRDWDFREHVVMAIFCCWEGTYYTNKLPETPVSVAGPSIK